MALIGSRWWLAALSASGLIYLVSLALPGCASSVADSWIEGRPKHHTENGFRNYPIVPEFAPLRSGFYFRRVMNSFFLPDVPDSHSLSEQQAIDQLKALSRRDSITWLGHSTFLLRLNGRTILTDPFLTEYAAPWEGFGPRRFVASGISVNNLPLIDIIIVSHNHFDHLDGKTIKALPGKQHVRVFVPLGLGDFFADRGYRNISELDWHDTASSGPIELTALPVVHASGRSLNDKNRTLWCGWSILAPNTHLFFSGDTAYSSTLFKSIGAENGPFDLAIVPIGAYKTRQYGLPSHLTPEQSVQLSQDINSRQVVAMHWGTIQLSDEPLWEPPELFRKAARNHGIGDKDAWLMKIGETRPLPGKF